MSVTISAVIITKNEEQNIERCLKAIDGWVDEIVVVDSHSSDRTREICLRFSKMRFVDHNWEGFSKTKNVANGLATMDYILSLDADEEISAELREKLLAIKNVLEPASRQAYEIDRLTNYCGQWIWHSGWRPDYQLRFFPRGFAEWDGAEVHEAIQLKPNVERHRIENVYLYHYSFYSIADHIERVNRYSSLGAEKIVRRQKGALVFRAIFNSFFRFNKSYFIKLGILDGFYGFVIAIVSAYAVFLKYAKAHQIMKTKKAMSR